MAGFQNLNDRWTDKDLISSLDGAASYDFDHDEIDRRLGWREPAEPVESDGTSTAYGLREFFVRVLGSVSSFDAVGRRAQEAFKKAKAARLEDPLSKAIDALAAWVTVPASKTGNQYRRSRAYTVGKRFVALVWVTNPALFKDGPSLTDLCARLGVSAPILSVLTSEASRHFGIMNRAQRNQGERPAKPEQAAVVNLDDHRVEVERILDDAA
jgi:hypothetical protein